MKFKYQKFSKNLFTRKLKITFRRTIKKLGSMIPPTEQMSIEKWNRLEAKPQRHKVIYDSLSRINI